MNTIVGRVNLLWLFAGLAAGNVLGMLIGSIDWNTMWDRLEFQTIALASVWVADRWFGWINQSPPTTRPDASYADKWVKKSQDIQLPG